jgi:hypothetical protein
LFCYVFTDECFAGVCDCCDGSDEIGTPFPIKCPGNCGKAIATVYTSSRFTRLRSRDLSSGSSAHFRITSPVKLPPIHLITSTGVNHSKSYSSPIWHYAAVFLCCSFFIFCALSTILQIFFPKGKNNPHVGLHSKFSRYVNGFFDYVWRPRKSDDCTV